MLRSCVRPSLPDRRDDGFTLIELLVVVVIIGVLIAIAIPLYLNYTQSAYDASVKADLRTLRNEEINYNANNTSFAGTQQLFDANPKLVVSPNSLGAVVWSSKDGFCLAVVNTSGEKDGGSPFASIGFPYRTYFYDSVANQTNTRNCASTNSPSAAPSGATGSDGVYVTSSGRKTF